MRKTLLKSVWALLLVVICSSCSQEVKHQVLELKEYDSISVAIDYPFLSDYTRLRPFVREGKMYAVGYNHYEHHYDFINLSGGEHISVKLQREGPDGVLVHGRFWVNEKGIVCQTHAGLVVLDMQGKVQHRVPMKELVAPEEIYLPRPRGSALANFDYAGSYGNRCFIPLSPLKTDVDVAIGKVYDTDTRSLELLPALYPEPVKVLFQVNSLTMPRINASHEDRLVYNFPYSSKVYLYDRQTQEASVFDMPSQTIVNELDMNEFNDENRERRELMTSRFDWVYYSAKVGKYYRVHHAERKKLSDLEENRKRKAYLMVYDEKEQTIKEYLLPTDFSAIYFIHDDVLFFGFDGADDEMLRFAKIDLGKL